LCGPFVLAFIARHILTGAVDGARKDYRSLGVSPAECSPEAISSLQKALRAEGERLSHTFVPSGWWSALNDLWSASRTCSTL
jgi:hypothetical protein